MPDSTPVALEEFPGLAFRLFLADAITLLLLARVLQAPALVRAAGVAGQAGAAFLQTALHLLALSFEAIAVHLRLLVKCGHQATAIAAAHCLAMLRGNLYGNVHCRKAA